MAKHQQGGNRYKEDQMVKEVAQYIYNHHLKINIQDSIESILNKRKDDVSPFIILSTETIKNALLNKAEMTKHKNPKGVLSLEHRVTDAVRELMKVHGLFTVQYPGKGVLFIQENNIPHVPRIGNLWNNHVNTPSKVYVPSIKTNSNENRLVAFTDLSIAMGAAISMSNHYIENHEEENLSVWDLVQVDAVDLDNIKIENDKEYMESRFNDNAVFYYPQVGLYSLPAYKEKYPFGYARFTMSDVISKDDNGEVVLKQGNYIKEYTDTFSRENKRSLSIPYTIGYINHRNDSPIIAIVDLSINKEITIPSLVKDNIIDKVMESTTKRIVEELSQLDYYTDVVCEPFMVPGDNTRIYFFAWPNHGNKGIPFPLITKTIKECISNKCKESYIQGLEQHELTIGNDVLREVNQYKGKYYHRGALFKAVWDFLSKRLCSPAKVMNVSDNDEFISLPVGIVAKLNDLGIPTLKYIPTTKTHQDIDYSHFPLKDTKPLEWKYSTLEELDFIEPCSIDISANDNRTFKLAYLDSESDFIYLNCNKMVYLSETNEFTPMYFIPAFNSEEISEKEFLEYLQEKNEMDELVLNSGSGIIVLTKEINDYKGDSLIENIQLYTIEKELPTYKHSSKKGIYFIATGNNQSLIKRKIVKFDNPKGLSDQYGSVDFF